MKEIIMNKKYLLVFLSILLLKLMFLFIANEFSFGKHYELEKIKGDQKSYLTAATNFVEKNSYEFAEKGDGETKYVSRMPGMAVILIPLMFLFSLSTSIKIFVFLQILISSCAFTVLFYFLKRKIKTSWLLWPFLFFIGLGSFINDYNGIVLSETIAQSLFIFIICYLLEERKNERYLILVGVLFAWLFFMRPFMIVYLPFLMLSLVSKDLLKGGIKSIVLKSKPALIFVIPLLVFTGLWTWRNYNKTNKFIPMEYSVRADKVTYLREFTPPLFQYIKRFGGNIYTTYNDQKSSHYLWFYPEKNLVKRNIPRPNDSIFPSFVFNSSFNLDSLNEIRTIIDSAMNYEINSKEREVYYQIFLKKITKADEIAKANTGFMFDLKNRLNNLWCFISPHIPDNKYYFNSYKIKKLVYIVNSIFNFLLITLPIAILSILFWLKKENRIKFSFYLLPAYTLLFIFSFYFNIKEERELFVFYPVFLISSLLFLDSVLNRFKQSKST